VLQDIEVGRPNQSARDRPAERTAAAHVRRPENRSPTEPTPLSLLEESVVSAALREPI
jgi:hypothetical protein